MGAHLSAGDTDVLIVVEDACRSIDVGGSAEAARSAFRNLGIQSIAAGDFT